MDNPEMWRHYSDIYPLDYGWCEACKHFKNHASLAPCNNCDVIYDNGFDNWEPSDEIKKEAGNE
jgi:hypothetical protein